MTVTAAVCTAGRRPDGLRRALDSVRAETPDEVLVIADGARLGELGADVRVVASRAPGPGGARATALDEARGDALAFCDDDDEWLPGHLSALTAGLRDADVAYGDAELVVDGAAHGVVAAPEFNFDDLYRRGNYIVPSETAFRVKAARAAGGFDPALGAHEDWDLWLRMPGRARRVQALVARRAWSADGVAAGEHWDVWERVVATHRARLESAGDHARHDIDVAAAPPRDFDRETWSDSRRELVVYGSLTEGYSYGDLCRRLVPALARCGVDVVVAPGRTQPPPGYERHFRELSHWGRLGLYLHVLSRPAALPCARTVAYSMWESTGIPDWRVDAINRGAAALLVPCEQNRAAFAERGVRTPVRVVHAGIDPAAFPLLERPRRDVFTFGTFGDLTPRKGIDVLLRAFRAEFAAGEPVRLVLKSGAPLALDIDDPRVEVVSGFYGADALLELLRGFDAFVMPSRGEGFGLCALEAMATGLPTIATAWGGPAEYLDESDSYPLHFGLADAGGTRVRDNDYRGLWAEPDTEHLRALMRSVSEDPAAAAARGRRASARVRREWTWDRAARDLRDELDAVAAA